MASGSLSPIPVNSPPGTSSNDHAKKSSSPTPSSAELAATGNNTSYDLRTNYHHHHHHQYHHHHRHHRHHHRERDDGSLSPSHRRSSRYDERQERRNNHLAHRHPQDRHYAPEPPISRRDYRDIDDQRSKISRNDNRNGDDSYRRTPLAASESPIAATTATEAASSSSSRHHGDSYRPTPLLPSESTSATPSSTSSSRHQDQYQTRYEESRYDRMGRRDDSQSDYSRHHPSSYHSSSSQHQHPQLYYQRERSPYSHRDHRTREPIQHRHEPYDDRRYQRHNSRHHTTRRIIDRGTEEERQKSTTIFTGNLPYDFCERDVAAMFERYGKLVKITIPIDSMTTKNKGFAFVEFEHRHEAQEAFDNFQGFSVGGRRLKLDWDIGLQKKDTRRTPRFEDYQHPMRSSSSSSPPPRNARNTDTYIPSRSQV